MTFNHKRFYQSLNEYEPDFGLGFGIWIWDLGLGLVLDNLEKIVLFLKYIVRLRIKRLT